MVIGVFMILYKKYKGELVEFQIDIDCPYYANYSWSAIKRDNGFYLYASDVNKYYHRIIMGEPKGIILTI